MAVKVAFLNEEDFFNEVMLESEQIENNVVRVEHQLATQEGGFVRHSLVATAIARGRLVELRRSFGTSYGGDQSSQAAERAEVARQWLVDELLKQRFAVRNGAFVEG